jgi:hypothetical protein
MQEHPVTQILNLWPTRQAVLEDVRAASPEIDMVAVHRWFQRGSVPARYWRALLEGAAKRGIAATADDLAAAHAQEGAA